MLRLTVVPLAQSWFSDWAHTLLDGGLATVAVGVLAYFGVRRTLTEQEKALQKTFADARALENEKLAAARKEQALHALAAITEAVVRFGNTLSVTNIGNKAEIEKAASEVVVCTTKLVPFVSTLGDQFVSAIIMTSGQFQMRFGAWLLHYSDSFQKASMFRRDLIWTSTLAHEWLSGIEDPEHYKSLRTTLLNVYIVESGHPFPEYGPQDEIPWPPVVPNQPDTYV